MTKYTPNNASIHPSLPPYFLWLVFFTMAVFTQSCSTYGERIAPVPLPSSNQAHINIQGALVAARAYIDEDEAEALFGFDIRDAGLIPVRFVVDNQSRSTVNVIANQTFLMDNQNQAWPLLTSDQAYRRVKKTVEIGETIKGSSTSAVLFGVAGGVAGFAIGLIAGGDVGILAAKGAGVGASVGAIYGASNKNSDLDKQIRRDLALHSLRNDRIKAGELAYGYLFFPGKDEAASAKLLRLGIAFDGKQRIVNLPL